jgi:hypothetical protein
VAFWPSDSSFFKKNEIINGKGRQEEPDDLLISVINKDDRGEKIKQKHLWVANN